MLLTDVLILYITITSRRSVIQITMQERDIRRCGHTDNIFLFYFGGVENTLKLPRHLPWSYVVGLANT